MVMIWRVIPSTKLTSSSDRCQQVLSPIASWRSFI
jgi:hypothetical protein